MGVNGRDVRSGGAFVELYLRDHLKRGLEQASKRLKGWAAGVGMLGAKISAAGAAITGPMLAAVRQFAQQGDALDKMSSRVGASVEFLSALAHAAAIGGTDLSAMEVGIRRLQRTAYDASRGLTTAQEAFADLGIEIRGADGQLKSTEQLFMEAASALAAMENNTHKAALATVIFGRAGTQLLPMLKQGRAGLVAVMKEAEELGIVLSTEDATAAAEMTDAWTRLTSVLRMAIAKIGAALVPMLLDLADRIKRLIRPVLDWIDGNRELVAWIFKLGGVLSVAGVALAAVAGVLFSAGVILGTLAKAVGLVTGLFSTLTSVVGFLLSPLGLTLAAVVALGVVLVKYTSAGAAAMQWLGEVIGGLAERFGTTFKAIGKALAAGDLRAALKVFVAYITMEFQRARNAGYQIWVKFKDWFVGLWTGATFGLARLLSDAWYRGQKAFADVVNSMRVIWNRFCSWAGNAWDGTIKGVGNFMYQALAKAGVVDQSVADAMGMMLDNEMDSQIQARTDAADAELAKISADWDKQIAELDAQQQTARAALDQDQAKRDKQRTDQYGRDLADSQAKLDQAVEDWQAAASEASDQPQEAPRSSMAQQRLDQALQGLGGDVTGGAGERLKSIGTFSGRQAARLGFRGPEERTARATEASAKQLAELNRKADRNTLVFTS